MKKQFLLCLGVLISTVATAQTVHVDILNKECRLINDSLIVQMSLSGNINDLNSRDAIVLTPYLVSQDGSSVNFDLPPMQFNGKYKHILYVRNSEMRSKMKGSEDVSSKYTQALGSNGKFRMEYRTSLPSAAWMQGATLQIKSECIDVDSQVIGISDIFVHKIEEPRATNAVMAATPAPAPAPAPASTPAPAPVREMGAPSPEPTQGRKVAKVNYKGCYVSPDSDATDERNQRDLNFSLEEAQVMVKVNPQILSIKELFTVAMSYKEDREKFYHIISTCVKLYPTHPIANLNAASMAIELGDKEAANKYLQIAPYESLAYKNCRGAYELMNGNVYEGIRLLKSAKAEGSEEAGYNLDLFFKQNK